MSNTPWYTSDKLIASVKRKILLPIAQSTFSENEILDFLNEEMLVAQVPAVLQWHEEYYVYSEEIELQANRSKYPIPQRAIGMRLRDVMWMDQNGNLSEMTRVDAGDKAFFQRNIGANTAIHKFYVENNDIVLTPSVQSSPTGRLVFYFFMRPNVLVKDERAAIIAAFHKSLTVTNASIVAGDTVIINGITFTAVVGAPSTNEFQIGGTSIVTATNLTAAINTNGVASASNGSPSTNVVQLSFDNYGYTVTSSNSSGVAVQQTSTIEFESVPDNITNGSKIDFLQTKPGHKILNYNIKLSSTAISTNDITFNDDDIPDDVEVGDYICLENETIIPQLPTDLHSGLAERACARILAALGDQQGLAAVNQKIGEISLKEGSLLDQRIEGAPKKINARHSLLHHQKMGTKRRF